MASSLSFDADSAFRYSLHATSVMFPVMFYQYDELFGGPGGLFGNSVLLRAIKEIVADSGREFRPRDLEILTRSSAPRIKNALDLQTSQGLLKKISGDTRRPAYSVNFESRRLVALTFLAYAVTDDRDETDCMDDAVIHYCKDDLGDQFGGCVSNLL